jgi:hypothetical protein
MPSQPDLHLRAAQVLVRNGSEAWPHSHRQSGSTKIGKMVVRGFQVDFPMFGSMALAFIFTEDM